MQTETVAPPLSEADSFTAFKEQKRAASSTDVKPATAEAPKIETPSVPKAEKPESESATASEAVVSQEKQKEDPPRTDAERRIRQLNAEKTRLEAEVAEYKRMQEERAAAKVVDPTSPKPAEQPKPAAEDPKPRRKETLGALALQFPSETYEELLDRYDDKVAEWSDRQEQRKAAEKQQAERKEAITKAVNEVLAESPDLEQKLRQVWVRQSALQFAYNLGANGLRALYRIGSDAAEAKRIAEMATDHEQIAAIVLHSQSSAAEPEKPQTPSVRPIFVSKAPKPVRSLSGVSLASDAPATTFGAYKAQKRKQA